MTNSAQITASRNQKRFIGSDGIVSFLLENTLRF